MKKTSLKQVFRFLTLQVILTTLTIFYFDRFLIRFEYGFDLIINNLLEDRLRFYRFIPYDFIKIDFYLALFVFIFLILLTTSKEYSYVNEFDFAINKSFYSEFLTIFLLWTSSFLIFLQMFRFTEVSRAYLVIFVIFVPILLTFLRNSEALSSFLGRSASDENYISFNIDENSVFRNLRILKFRKTLADYQVETKNFHKEIYEYINSLNKTNNINLVAINIEEEINIDSEFEDYLLNLNKKILLISKKPVTFNNNFIYREEIVNGKFLTYINNDIQYGSRYILKRFIDIFISIICILLFSPILLSVGLYLLITDGRPVVIKQNRVGLHGKPFMMYKFRTMKQNSHSERKELKDLNTQKGPLFKIENDPRLLRGAKHIRKFSLDELPQFFNVLSGKMSVVGPRPLFVEDSETFNKDYLRRLNVLPGITGLLQIEDRNTDDFETWFKYDLEYIENWSIALDLEIIIKTPFSMFKREIQGK